MPQVRSSGRLHKLLAQHGLGSRREIEKWMLAGRVLLNSRPAQPGDRYTPGDRVVVDGKDVTSRLKPAAAPQVIIYHKPQGQPITAGDPAAEVAAEKSVMESLPAVRGARWLVVNTMQAGDSGLLLLTSDGRLADALRRRAEATPSAYVARVLVPTPDFDVASIPRVVRYDEDTIEFESIEPAGGEGTNRWFRVESHRAHRRAAVRALFESRGLKVSRVIQVQFADLELPRDLPRGKYRALSEKQVTALYARAELAVPQPEETPARDERPRRRPAPDRRKRKAPHTEESRKAVHAAGNRRVPHAAGSSKGPHAATSRSKSTRFTGSEAESPAAGRRLKPSRPTGNRRSGR